MIYRAALLRQRSKQRLIFHTVDCAALHCVVSKLSNYKVAIPTKVNTHR